MRLFHKTHFQFPKIKRNELIKRVINGLEFDLFCWFVTLVKASASELHIYWS